MQNPLAKRRKFMKDNPHTKAAVEFLRRYQEAYASITGLRYDVSGNEVLETYENLLKDDIFLDRIKRRHGMTVEEFKEKYLMPFSKEDNYLDRLATQLVEYNSITDSVILNIPVGTLPTSDCNAAALKTDAGDKIIVLNTGTVAYMSEVLNSFLGTISTPFSPPLWSIEDAAITIIQWSTAVATGTPKYGMTKTPVFNDPYLIGASGSVGDNARVFILGHEYGHFLLGHHEDSQTQKLTLVPDTDAAPLEFYLADQQQEFEADLKGVELCIQWCKNTHKGSYQVAFLSIIFAFHLLKLLEVCRTFPIKTPSHPPSDLRREYFEKQYSNMFDEQIKKEIAYLDYFMDKIYSYIEIVKAKTG